MASYTVLRMAKLKTWGEVGGAGAHNLRQRDTPNADPSRGNRVLVGAPDASLADEVRAKIGDQTIRKNAVLAVEFVLSASPEYFRPDAPEQGGTWDEDRLERWTEASMGWLQGKYGDRLVSAVLHLDEQTPHIQAVLVPLDDKGKLNARALFGGTRHRLSELQTDYAKSVEPLGIQRGIEGSRAKHTDLAKYYAMANTPFEPLPEVRTKAPALRPEPEKPGLLAGSETKQAYQADHEKWVREKAHADKQRAQRQTELKALYGAAVPLANRYQAQAREAAVLRKQVAELKQANGQLVRRVAELEHDVALADFELERAMEVVGLFKQTEIDNAREREDARQRRLRADRARADLEAEQQRRADRLAKRDRNASGAAATFDTHARQALERAGGDWRRVDWKAVDALVATVAIRDHGQSPESVAEAVLARSPGRADPATHAEVREGVARHAPALQAQHREARRARARGPEL
ncbi:MAG: MobV family relaxase [Polaromonas sp.]